MSEMTRRDWIALTMGAGAALALDPKVLFAQGRLMTRPIPSSGEQLPVVGLGSSATFSQVARSEDIAGLREVMKAMLDGGATVFDTAPSYGASEEVAGRIAAEIGATEKVFWATKVNVVPRGGGPSADPAAAKAQIDRSFERLKKSKIDLIQVHNLADVPTQLGILKDLKAQGRVRYIGVTTTSERQYEQLASVMKSEPIDFIGVDYAVDNREVETTILPLAKERKIAVMVYVPFGRTRLFRRVADRALPDWAAEFDAKSWAQFFLKFVLAHPAVTVVTPATSQAKHMIDNLGAATGRLPDEALRKRMVELVDSLPSAG
ncbi:MAG: aldo/keto reductase [Vicinamibacteraceae bacterium]|nr:aldo/keto reductase [Vicinamibacteraceae bacterium]